MKNAANILLALGLLFFVTGCGGESKSVEIKSGRLKFIKMLKYGSVGTHGSQGWYVTDRDFSVNGKNWSPDGIEMKQIEQCDAAPNETVEALKCYSLVDLKQRIYILRMKNDQPEWLTAAEANQDHDSGVWVGDGRWLLFKDSYFNVETSERREIKGLPDYPGDDLLAASPDLSMIIYEESCLMSLYDPQTNEKIANKLLDERCRSHYKDNIYEGVAAFWLIDAKTGSVEILELKESEYPSLKRGENIPGANRANNFKKMIVWEKDQNGKDRLKFPKSSK